MSKSCVCEPLEAIIKGKLVVVVTMVVKIAIFIVYDLLSMSLSPICNHPKSAILSDRRWKTQLSVGVMSFAMLELIVLAVGFVPVVVFSIK